MEVRFGWFRGQRKGEKMKDAMIVKGFMRVQLTDSNGKIVGDSGWRKNVVTNLGFQDYICGSVGGIVGAKSVSWMAIGTGGAPVATDTVLAGETGVRVTTSNSVSGSKTLQCTAQFSGTAMGSTVTIQNVALANTSSGGTILAGTTYSTSQWASNQNVNATLKGRVELVVTLIKQIREFGETLKNLFETIPSRASRFIFNLVEGVETMHGSLAISLGELKI